VGVLAGGHVLEFAVGTGRNLYFMFLTDALRSYGPATATGAPRDPATYGYRRAAWVRCI
jgi:hypothetical protein